MRDDKGTVRRPVDEGDIACAESHSTESRSWPREALLTERRPR